MALTPYPKLKAALFPQGTPPSVLPSDVTLYHLLQVLCLGSLFLYVSARSLPENRKPYLLETLRVRNRGKEGWSSEPTPTRMAWKRIIYFCFKGIYRPSETHSGSGIEASFAHISVQQAFFFTYMFTVSSVQFCCSLEIWNLPYSDVRNSSSWKCGSQMCQNCLFLEYHEVSSLC